MKKLIRNATILVSLVCTCGLVGCAGPEKKLGRGMRNATELVRGGEMRRSVEQTALWEGPQMAYTTGFLRGFNRTMARTGIGIYEIVTFPFPSYDPLLTPEHRLYPDTSIRTTKYPYGGLRLPEQPVFPDSYTPQLISDSTFDTDTALGFSGGDVAPFVPGSRFRIFDHN